MLESGWLRLGRLAVQRRDSFLVLVGRGLTGCVERWGVPILLGRNPGILVLGYIEVSEFFFQMSMRPGVRILAKLTKIRTHARNPI